MSISDLRTEIAERGFAVVESLVADAVVREYLDELDARLRGSDGAIRRRAEIFAARNLVELVPETRRFLGRGELSRIVREIFSEAHGALTHEPRLVRALLLDKSRRSNWFVPWHQDQFVAVRKRCEVPGFGAWTRKAGVDHARAPAHVLERMVTIRIHLDACDESAGPLRVAVGSHRAGVLSAERIGDAISRAELVS